MHIISLKFEDNPLPDRCIPLTYFLTATVLSSEHFLHPTVTFLTHIPLPFLTYYLSLQVHYHNAFPYIQMLYLHTIAVHSSNTFSYPTDAFLS